MQWILDAEWGAGEYRDLLAALAGGRHNRGPESAALQARLEVSYGRRPLLFANRGRHALRLALRTFAQLRPGRNEVIFPAYVCPSVVEAIEHAGLAPVAADIRDDLNIDPGEIERRFSTRTLAVVAAHMYGCPAPIEDIDALCKARGVFLIDDAAQLAGVAVGGRPPGCYGDCGLVSFSLSKSLVAGSINAGAFLIVNNPGLEADLRHAWEGLPEGHYAARDLAAFLCDGPFSAALSPVAYYSQQIRRRLSAVEPGSDLRHCPPRRMANANAVVVLHQLDSLSRRIDGRIRVAAAFNRRLAHDGIAIMPQFAAGRYLTRVMVRLPPGIEPPRLRRSLHQRGIETRLAYPLYAQYACAMPRAAEAKARLIELPSGSHMGDGAIDDVVAIFADAVARVRAACS